MTADEYVDLSWTWRFDEDPEDPGTIIATIDELPDFSYAGDSKEEAYAAGRDALHCLIGSYLQRGEPIPLPPDITLAASQSPDR